MVFRGRLYFQQRDYFGQSWQTRLLGTVTRNHRSVSVSSKAARFSSAGSRGAVASGNRRARTNGLPRRTFNAAHWQSRKHAGTLVSSFRETRRNHRPGYSEDANSSRNAPLNTVVLWNDYRNFVYISSASMAVLLQQFVCDHVYLIGMRYLHPFSLCLLCRQWVGLPSILVLPFRISLRMTLVLSGRSYFTSLFSSLLRAFICRGESFGVLKEYRRCDQVQHSCLFPGVQAFGRPKADHGPRAELACFGTRKVSTSVVWETLLSPFSKVDAGLNLSHTRALSCYEKSASQQRWPEESVFLSLSRILSHHPVY